MEISFLGIGSAWNIQEDNTSAYIKSGNKMILIDCGETIARKIISENTLSDVKELYILISHTHSDHIGSLGTLLFYSKYNNGIKNKIVLPNDVEYSNNLKEYLRLVDISSEVEYIDENTFINELQLINFEMLKATHTKTLPCYCFAFQDKEGVLYYSADNSNVEYIKKYLKCSNSKIYTEICDNQNMEEEHLTIKKLENSIDVSDKKRIYLMHINEMLDINRLIKEGYKIPDVKTRKREKYNPNKYKE